MTNPNPKCGVSQTQLWRNMTGSGDNSSWPSREQLQSAHVAVLLCNRVPCNICPPVDKHEENNLAFIIAAGYMHSFKTAVN